MNCIDVIDPSIYGAGATGLTTATRNTMLNTSEDLKQLYSKVVLKQEYNKNLRFLYDNIFKNSDVFYEVSPTYTNRDAFKRLNTTDAGGNGREKPATAAQLEPFLGKMKRLPEKSINGQKQADGDFIIMSGSNTGKIVDFIFTTKGGDQREIDGINFKFEDKLKAMTADSNSTIPKHLKKADIIPVDYRILNPSNQAVFTNYLKTLSTKDQAKFLIMK